ncbi:GNAT family N-acetyltransferase [Parvibaculaceae bacterium PLY_AMNH_Bact1]|nr:GNAT family N-acetyltransferase [Parvibaculaceae bacterium PLY_AMNH_Bact1]
MSEITIRWALAADIPQINKIYNHYIRETPITFDIEEKTDEDSAYWLQKLGTTGRYQCFVAVKADTVLGWACSGAYRPKAAYGTSVEVSVYLDPNAGGQGLGTALYTRLFEALKDEDVHRALAGVTLPNDASLALHRRFGFTEVGTYSEVGRKFDTYWDVMWLEKLV